MKITHTNIHREEVATRYLRVEGAEPVVEYVVRGRRADLDRPVMLMPEVVRVRWVNGELVGVRVDGKRMKANGTPGVREGYRSWGAHMVDHPERYEHPTPQWLIDLVRVQPEPSMLEYQTYMDQERRARGH